MKFKKFIQEQWFSTCIFLILVISAFLRFHNYGSRWSLWVDQASFALLARYALQAHELPLLGPFSSAGPFQTGGEWYWLIMLATAIYPNMVITPWVVLTLLFVLFVFFIIFIGKELVSKKFGLLLGLLAAVSTAQIAQSADLTNQSPLAFIALCAIWAMISYVKTNKLIYLFLLSLFVGFASTIHLQGVALVIIIPVTIVFTRHSLVRGIILSLAGLFLPWLPILIADSHNHFLNTQNMFRYYFHDQYLISLDVLGRRWLTFLGIFLPNAWSHVIGGNFILGYVLIILSGVTIVYNFLKRQLSKEWYILVISFLVMLILVRYTHTPLFDSFIVFAHPFILLFTALGIFLSIKKNVIFGFLFLVLIMTVSLNKDIKQIANASNATAMRAETNRSVLVGQYPNAEFAIYDYKFKTPGISLPLALFMDERNKIDDDGIKVGVSIATFSAKLKLPIIYEKRGEYYILDISSLSEKELYISGWESVNPSAIYRNVQEWYKYKK